MPALISLKRTPVLINHSAKSGYQLRQYIRTILTASAALCLATGLSAHAGDDPALPQLSPASQAVVAPVHEAFVKAEAEQAKLPPARTDSEQLERMLDLDQAGRKVFVQIDFSKLPKDEQLLAQSVAWRDIKTHDLADQKALKAMMPVESWFTQPQYSPKAITAAFLIVQHAVNDPDLMRDVLKRMEPLVKAGWADGPSYGLLYDRVSLQFDHKPQRYGSQVQCKAGQWQPNDLEDPAHVDERRKAMGYVETEAEYLKHFTDNPCD